MLKVHFTAADLARTRLRTTAGPLVETAFVHGLLSRGVGAPYARWRRQVTKRLPQWPVLMSGNEATTDPDVLLRVLEQYTGTGATDDAVEDSPQVSQLPVHQDAAGLPEVWRGAVAPYWGSMIAYLEAECDARGRVVMAGGVELLLTTLHPRIKWRSPVLEIPGGPDEDLVLDGRGLVLAPSVFLTHRPASLTGTRGRNGEVVLAFSAPPDSHRAATLWQSPDDSGQSLGALVGQTRAAALRVLRMTCTTGQLADRLGISAAGASQHTAVLRQNGLITTRRIRNTVLHTVTPLGLALLDGMVTRPDRDRSGRQRVPAQSRRGGAVNPYGLREAATRAC